jgi:hypothetical protein
MLNSSKGSTQSHHLPLEEENLRRINSWRKTDPKVTNKDVKLNVRESHFNEANPNRNRARSVRDRYQRREKHQTRATKSITTQYRRRQHYRTMPMPTNIEDLDRQVILNAPRRLLYKTSLDQHQPTNRIRRLLLAVIATGQMTMELIVPLVATAVITINPWMIRPLVVHDDDAGVYNCHGIIGRQFV